MPSANRIKRRRIHSVLLSGGVLFIIAHSPQGEASVTGPPADEALAGASAMFSLAAGKS